MATSAYCPLECRSPTGFGASRRTQERPHGQRLGNGLRRPSLGPALPAPLGLRPDADMNGCQSGGMTTRWKPRLAAYQSGEVRHGRDGLLFSPSDLHAFLACPHLTTLELAVAGGRLERPFRVNLHADLIRRKGEEHERGYLERLRAEGREIVEIGFDDRDWERAARETERAIQGGADVVYQGCLAEGNWRGIADFL